MLVENHLAMYGEDEAVAVYNGAAAAFYDEVLYLEVEVGLALLS